MDHTAAFPGEPASGQAEPRHAGSAGRHARDLGLHIVLVIFLNFYLFIFEGEVISFILLFLKGSTGV